MLSSISPTDILNQIEQEIQKVKGWLPVRDHPPQLSGLLTEAEGYLLTYILHSKENDIHNALTNYQRIIHHNSFESFPIAFKLDVLNRVAVTLSYIYDLTRENEIIEKRIDVLNRLINEAPKDWPDLCNYFFNLAILFHDKFGLTSDPIFQIKCLQLLEKATEIVPADHRNNNLFQQQYISQLSNLYKGTGTIKYLEEAIVMGYRYLEKPFIRDTEKRLLLSELSNLYRHKCLRFRDVKYIDTSILYGKESLEGDISNLTAEQKAICMSNLGNALFAKAHFPGSEALLRDATLLQIKAIRLTKPKNPMLCVRYNNLGNCFQEKYSRENKVIDLTKTIDYYNKAIITSPKGDNIIATRYYNLANVLVIRFNIQKKDTDVFRATENYKLACTIGLKMYPEWALLSSVAWGNFLVSQHDYNGAIIAFRQGFDAMNILYNHQFSRTDKNLWLREATQLTNKLAYVQLKCGKKTEAIITLEQGLARNLRENFQRNEVTLNRLKRIDASLFEEYTRSLKEYDQAIKSNVSISMLDDIRHKQHAILSRIHKLDNFENFRQIPDKQLIERAVESSNDKTFIYMIATGDNITFIVIHQCLQEDKIEILETALQSLQLKDFLEKYYIRYIQNGDHNEFKSALFVLFPYLKAQIQKTFAKCALKENCILILTGFFDLLPIHSLFPEHIHVTVVPSIISYSEVSAQFYDTLKYPNPTVLCLANTQPEEFPLEFTAIEIDSIKNNFQKNILLLTKQNGSKRNFIKNISAAQYIHFACHSYFDWSNPLNSGIQFNDGMLTLKELFEEGYDMGHIRLVSISSCQSGISEIEELPDEAISFPAGFLQAGAMGVISSLWSVSDISTSLLMKKFYDCHIKEQMEPAKALKIAQQWLSGSTNKSLNLATIYNETWKDTNEKRFAQLALYSGRNPEHSPFSHPYYWAGFYYSGF